MLRERARIEPLIAGYWVVALDRSGVQRSSKQIADLVREREERPPQRTAFVLGGPHGHRRDAAGRGRPDLEPRQGHAAAPARARGRARAAVPRVHDPARRALPPLTRRPRGQPWLCSIAMPDALSLLAAPLIEAAWRLGAPDSRRCSSARPIPSTATTRRRSRCGSPSRCGARRARSPRRSRRPRARATGSRAPTLPGRASSTCACRPRGTPRPCAWRARPGYGGGTASPPLRVNVEYVSANPTGPLPVSAGRNAAYGDSLARLFAFAGHDVVREYYFNDAGAQIERFGLSLRASARGEPVPEDGYQGEALIELAAADRAPARCIGRGVRPRRRRAHVRGHPRRRWSASASRWTCTRTRSTCTARAGSSARSSAPRAAGHVFEQDGATWLRASAFGDDKDRVLVEVRRRDRRTSPAISPTSWTSSSAASTWRSTSSAPTTTATPRGCGRPRQALGYDPARIEIAIYQMVHLIEDGEQKRMSKRRGDVVLLDELMDGIGVDAARFYLVQRSHDATIDIDLAQAVEQGPENPVYYVQYAHARICSILRRAGEVATADARRRDRARSRARRRSCARSPTSPTSAARPSSCGRRIASSSTPATWPRRSRRSTATARCWTPTRPSAVVPARALRCDAAGAGARARPRRRERARGDVETARGPGGTTRMGGPWKGPEVRR